MRPGLNDGARPTGRRTFVLVAGAVSLVIAIVVGAALFTPWRLFVDRRVDEAIPSAAGPGAGGIEAAPASPAGRATRSVSTPAGDASPGPTPAGDTSPVPTPAADTSPTPQRPRTRTVATGTLISHEHPTTGRIRVLELPDGSRILRIEELDTSNGPDLRVWLSSAPVVQGRAGWFVFDDHDHVELGRLKANQGSQNYTVPASADLDELTSVTIWCRRFHVSFGAAALRPS